MRCSVRITIPLSLSMALLALPAQKQPAPAAPAAPIGGARGAMVHFVLDRTLKTPVQPIRGLSFGGDHPTLAALGDDGNVRVWNAVTGELLKTIALADRPKSVSCIAFSPDGKWIVVGEDFTKAEVFTGKIELLDAVRVKWFERSQRIIGKWRVWLSARMADGWPPAIGTVRCA